MKAINLQTARKRFAQLILVVVMMGMISPAHAAILFQDDTFATIDSDVVQIGANDAGSLNTGIQFGTNVTPAMNGNISFNTSSQGFNADHPLTIQNDTTNDSLRVNDAPGDTTPFVVTTNGDVGIGKSNPGAALDVNGNLRLSGASSGYVGFSTQAAAGSTTYVLPSSDGTTGQALTTNGSGVLSWSSAGTNLWQRVGTVLSPLTAGDSVTTSGAGTITSAGLLTGQSGLSITGGNANINVSSNNNTNINTGTSTGTVNVGNSLAGAINVQSGSNVTLQSGNSTLTTGNTALTLQPAGSGTTGTVQIGGGGAGSTTPDTFNLDVKSSAGDPAGANGAMYYNASSNAFRCFTNGVWGNCDTTGAPVSLQTAYDNGGTIATAAGTPILFTLSNGNFNANGAGAVNLTPTAASSFTSGGALTLRAGAASTWSTTAGALTINAGTTTAAALNLGTASSNAVNIGRTGITTTNNGALTSTQTLTASNGLTQTTGALNLTATSGALSITGLTASSISSGANSFTLTGTPINLNTSGTGSTVIGSATGAVNLPGLSASSPVFTDASKNLTSSGTLGIAQGGTGQTTAITSFNALSPLTTKGDVLGHDGTNNIRVPVGTNGQVLSADSTQTSGLKWVTVSGTGTVTSVNGSGGTTGLTITGGPITTSGTLTLGGILGLANGGTNNNITADNGAVVYSDANKLNLVASSLIAGKVLQSGASGAPSWSTPTYPSGSGAAGKIIRSNGTNNVYSTSTFADTYSASNLLYSSGANNVVGLPTANNGILLTDASGVPSISSTLDFTNATSMVLPSTTSDPLTCTPGQIYYNTTTQTQRLCTASNTWVSAGGSGTNYISAYDTTTQTASGAGVFSDVLFNTNAMLSQWSHTPSTATFTAAVAGTFMAHITAEVVKSGGANTDFSLRAVKNGTEIPGSQSDCGAAASTPNTCAANFLTTVNAGDIIKIQMASGQGNGQITPGGFGTVRPSITLLVWRLG